MTPRQRIKRISRLLTNLPRSRLPHQKSNTFQRYRRILRIEDVEELLHKELSWLAEFALAHIDDDTLNEFPPGSCEDCGRRMPSADANGEWCCNDCASASYDYPEP